MGKRPRRAVMPDVSRAVCQPAIRPTASRRYRLNAPRLVYIFRFGQAGLAKLLTILDGGRSFPACVMQSPRKLMTNAGPGR